MDQVFLDIVDNDPDFMKGALIKLFSSKNHDAQIRFLSDIPNIFDLIKTCTFSEEDEFKIKLYAESKGLEY